jgi:VanZ family protein
VNSVTPPGRPSDDAHELANTRLLAWALATYTLLVLCASLYPFTFAPADPVEQGLRGLLAWRRPTNRDLLVNLLAYVPIGWAATHLLRARTGAPRAAALGCLSAAALSLCIELLQQWVTVRVPSLADFALNCASGAAGSLLASAQPRRSGAGLATRLRRLHVSPALALLLVLWLAAHAAPFFPRLRWSLIAQAIDAAAASRFEAERFATYFASVLVLSAVLRTLVRRDAFWPLFIFVLVISLLLRLGFVGQALTLDQCFAALVAVPLVAWLRRRGHRSAQTPLFLWILAALLVAGTAPWHFTDQANAIDWRPFAALIAGRDAAGMTGLLIHAFLWIGAVWVGAGSRFGLRRAALTLAALGVITEIAQCFIVERVADPTQLLLVAYGALLVRAARTVDEPAPRA